MFGRKKRKNKETDYIPVCELCAYSAPISDTDELICSKRGVVSKDGKCRKFIYDPLKRVPFSPAKAFNNLSLPDDDDL